MGQPFLCRVFPPRDRFFFIAFRLQLAFNSLGRWFFPNLRYKLFPSQYINQGNALRFQSEPTLFSNYWVDLEWRKLDANYFMSNYLDVTVCKVATTTNQSVRSTKRKFARKIESLFDFGAHSKQSRSKSKLLHCILLMRWACTSSSQSLNLSLLFHSCLREGPPAIIRERNDQRVFCQKVWKDF